MITILLWTIFYLNAVWLVRTVEVCQLPFINRDACKLDKIKFTGTVIHSDVPAKDFETCALYCMWSEEKCLGVSFEISGTTNGRCTLLSEVTGCELNQNNWKSGFDCFASQIGVLYEWKMFSDDIRKDIDGSHLVSEGTDVVLSCSIPRLNDLFILTDHDFKWYKRAASSEPKVEIQGNGHELILKSVKRPSGGQSFDGLYSCEIGIFSKIILKSPEDLLRVVYLGKNLVGPTKEKFTLNDEYVMLGCTPPDSYPPAVVEWYKGHTHNHEPISKVVDLKYMVIDGKLIILNPTKSTQDFYFCRARNTILERSEESNIVLVNCYGGPCRKNDPNTASAAANFDRTEIATSLKTLQNENGVWLDQEKVFRCFFGSYIGERISWKHGGDIFQEGDGVNFLEGGQVLMLSPEKMQELHNTGVKEVSCSVPGEEYKISLPTIANKIMKKTFMLNLDPDLDDFDATLGTLLKVEEVVRHIEGDKYLFASVDVSQEMSKGDLYLDFLALRGDTCGEYALPSCSFNNVALGESAINSLCPGVTAYCKLHSLTETAYWIDDARSGCELDQISNSKLDGIQILEGQLVELTLSEDPCPVSAQMLLQELEENMEFYADETRLSAALMILTKISASLNVSSTFQTRSKELTQIYMRNAPLDGDKSIVDGDKFTLVLWEISFPLTEDATLEFSSLAKGENKSELTLKLPVGLSDIPALTGSQAFLVSLYHNPNSDYNELRKGTKYASKVVDIDPPTKLSDLDENQEIKIGIRLANEDKFNSENYPMCYWYDTATLSWRTDGVKATGFNDGILECTTTHLTAFSALLSAGLQLPPEHERALSYLTYTLGGLSCLSIVFTLVALLAFKDIRRSPSNKIHVCLTTTMLFAMILFIAGAKRHDGASKTTCKAIAIVLHYLWLTVFMWTVVESYNLYLLFIRILSARSSTFIFKFVVPVFVIPGVIVGLTAGLSYDSYTDENYCLLRHSTGDELPMIYYSFYLPIGVSILVNGAIFVAVVIKVFKKGRYQRFESKVQKLLSQIKAVCTLSCVLGLTWALGFLTFDHPADIVFHYLFTICNCIQGLLIFFFHCAIKPDIYQKWLSFLFHKESKSAPSSRSNTPTKSRLDLFTGIFQKRSSTVTLSTTVTKMSLTKQLTRQRTNSKDSLASGIQTAMALMKKASLEPLQEKESSAATASPKEQGIIVRKKMLSSHSSHGETAGNDLTPPGNAIPNYFDFMELEPQGDKPSSPKRSMPRSIVHAETKIRNVVAAIIPDQQSNMKKEPSIAANKDHVMAAGRDINKNRQSRPSDRIDRNGGELNLEDRLFRMGTPDSEVDVASSSGKRSASPLDLIRGWRRVSPSPPLPPDFTVPVESRNTSNLQLKHRGDHCQSGTVKEVLSPKASLEIKPPIPITSKLSQLEEWIL